MDYLPIFLAVAEAPCLVVGGGEVAARKAALLQRAGGRVTVVSPDLGPALAARVAAGEVAWRQREFEPGDVAGFRIAVAATDRSEVNVRVSEAAKSLQIPVNVVDCPDLCTFIFPAIVERAPLVVAVSSGGASPVLARVLRMRLETLIPPAFGRLAGLADRFRQRVKEAVPDPRQRRKFWEGQLQGPVADLVFAGREAEAEARLCRALEEEPLAARTGMVYLVGAGPGDPDLLTLRALRLIQEADVVVYDRLVSAEILERVRRDAEMIYAGKQRDQHTLPQAEINQLLAGLARQGKRVVRLKGGDPFIFGRGGEEIETLMEQGIPFQVVPGITAASGCAAYAGIPLTHRDYAQVCTFLTGHMKDGRLLDIDWERWVQPCQTLVFYMGLQGLSEICEQLIHYGSSPDLPAALVQQGTTRRQRVLAATLATLPEKVRQSNVKAPTLLIVGEVVKLREKLGWFDPSAAPG
jgi:uroporphyrin-III C-methyltransferase/precorrin-2 dehydrogenase/sirohydrochlorin ferrochelatase